MCKELEIMDRYKVYTEVYHTCSFILDSETYDFVVVYPTVVPEKNTFTISVLLPFSQKKKLDVEISDIDKLYEVVAESLKDSNEFSDSTTWNRYMKQSQMTCQTDDLNKALQELCKSVSMLATEKISNTLDDLIAQKYRLEQAIKTLESAQTIWNK